MRVKLFLVFCLALAQISCGQMHAIPGLSTEGGPSESGGIAKLYVTKDLKVSSSGRLINKRENEVHFSTGSGNAVTTVRYKFNSLDAAAIQINRIMTTCASSSPMRIFGAGHSGEILDLNKASLIPNSVYMIETEVKSSCPKSSIDLEVWTGPDTIQPTRYLRCGDDVLLPMQSSGLTVVENKIAYVNSSTFCGTSLPVGNRELHQASILISLLSSQRDLEVTVNGVPFHATSKFDSGNRTLRVTCSRSGSVFQERAYSDCGEMIDDENLVHDS